MYLKFTSWKISGRYLMMNQLTVTVFCLSFLTTFTGSVLQEDCINYFLHSLLLFHHWWFVIIFKDDLYVLHVLKHWNRYVRPLWLLNWNWWYKLSSANIKKLKLSYPTNSSPSTNRLPLSQKFQISFRIVSFLLVKKWLFFLKLN